MKERLKENITKYLDEFDDLGYDLNEEFKKAILLAEFSDKNLIISGSAGTGKSTFVEMLKKNTKKNLVLLAPTGVAAVNIGGVTIHSFFKMAHGIVNKFAIFNELREIIDKIDIIIIDEISMVRSDLMDAIDYQLRVLTGNSNKSFGGIKIIAVGDLFQIPPIVKRNSPDEKYIKENFYSPWFFSAPEIGDFTSIELKKIYRQHDKEFAETLNRIRTGSQTRDDLSLINQRVIKERDFGKNYIYITTTNFIADKINKEKLQNINEKIFTYYATKTGDFSEHSVPAPSVLELKLGAQVMMVKNKNRFWYNGQIGVIKKINNEGFYVDIEGVSHYINKEIWKNSEYKLVDGKIRLIEKGSYTQFPVKLAYAITIHKSQSKTFDKIFIDLGNGAFSSGQTYVALSRCKTLQGIGLKYKIDKKDIIVDKTLKKHFL